MTLAAGSVIVGGVSHHPPGATPNGDVRGALSEEIDNATLLARIEMCITRSDTAARESVRARQASEEALQLVHEVKRATMRLASDHFALRSGIPPTWRRRVAFALTAGAFGAVAGAVVFFVLRGIH